MKSKLSAVVFSRRFYLLVVFFVFCLAMFAFQSGSSAQSTAQSSVECPQLGMCIVDPATGRCMSIKCPASSSASSSATPPPICGPTALCQWDPPPTPTPTPVCVTGPCVFLPPTPTPTPVCLPLEPIDSCTIDPINGGCLSIQPPCITPSVEPSMGPDAGPLIITEFRFRGPGGVDDEYVELFNPHNYAITVFSSDSSAGWSLVGSDGIVRFTIPTNTVIPAYGHYLGVNSLGYSLGGYPAAGGRNATGDASFILDIPDAGGIALFSTSNPANFTLAHRLDAAGYNTAPALYREGAGFPVYAAETFLDIEYSFYRDMVSGSPRDTNDNVADFRGVDVNAANTGAGQYLGAPGPENLSGPVLTGSNKIQFALLDPLVTNDQAPNRVRDTTPDPMNNSSLGTLSIRRTLTNVSGANITRLRFRIIDITTYPYQSGTSDIRAISSGSTVATRSDGSNVFVNGTTVETPPAQPNGGGWNSTWTVNSITPSSPLAPGQSISVQFLLGVQQSGYFRIFVVIEALP